MVPRGPGRARSRETAPRRRKKSSGQREGNRRKKAEQPGGEQGAADTGVWGRPKEPTARPCRPRPGGTVAGADRAGAVSSAPAAISTPPAPREAASATGDGPGRGERPARPAPGRARRGTAACGRREGRQPTEQARPLPGRLGARPPGSPPGLLCCRCPGRWGARRVGLGTARPPRRPRKRRASAQRLDVPRRTPASS